jgi:hypothetical protein
MEDEYQNAEDREMSIVRVLLENRGFWYSRNITVCFKALSKGYDGCLERSTELKVT